MRKQRAGRERGGLARRARAVFGRDGRLLFQHVRGLEPLESLLLGNRRFWVQDRAKPFDDVTLLNDQVRAAFEPLLAASGPSR